MVIPPGYSVLRSCCLTEPISLDNDLVSGAWISNEFLQVQEVDKKSRKKKETERRRNSAATSSSSGESRTDTNAAKANRSCDASHRSDPPTYAPSKQGIFREIDIAASASDPLQQSILGASFYSEDSADPVGVSSLEHDHETNDKLEVDYEISTPLFETLEQSDWCTVLFFLRTGKFFSDSQFTQIDSPERQVRTWVYARDSNSEGQGGAIIWRQLPLHAAICLSAPLRVVERLVELYPEALDMKDSFGNLPRDLAAKLNSPHGHIFQAADCRARRVLDYIDVNNVMLDEKSYMDASVVTLPMKNASSRSSSRRQIPLIVVPDCDGDSAHHPVNLTREGVDPELIYID